VSSSATEPDGGALSIAAADGYHYADDHPWKKSDQDDLIDDSWTTLHTFREGAQHVPVYSAEIVAES
jgi:hypothetical protein